MAAGRRNDSLRRRQRVLSALAAAQAAHQEISVSSIAKAAGVDRSFLYRHRDLLDQIHSTATEPVLNPSDATITRASLQTDLLNTQQRAARLAARVQQSRNTSPPHSARKPGENPASALPTTSTNCSDASPNSNKRSWIFDFKSMTAPRNCAPRGPPTAK